MLVVADSSPINFLVRLRQVDLLQRLFAEVVVPSAVIVELNHPATPEVVRSFATSPPNWLLIRTPKPAPGIPRLHLGELAAIQLAIELRADLILIDDGVARRAAQERGLRVTGLIGILDSAAEHGLIDLPRILQRLPRDYRIAPSILNAVLERDAARRNRQTP